MKQHLQFVAAIAITVFMPVVMSVPVVATESIDNTGGNSENEVNIDESFDCDIDSDNNVTIINSENNEAGSGSVDVDDDRNGGGAISGSASNNSEVTFNVVITNGECDVTGVVPVTPKKPETEESGRDKNPAPVQPTQDVTPKALPVTSGSAGPVVLATLGGVTAVAGIAVAYRRLHL